MEIEPYSARSADAAAKLVSSFDVVRGSEALVDAETAAALLRGEGWIVDELAPADLEGLRALRPRLRYVFELDDEQRAVAHLNGLLAELDALPQMTDHDGHWHFHYARPGAPVWQRVATSFAMSLLLVIRDRGFDRLRRCEAPDCGNVLADLSKNRSRRYCDARTCGNRASVAAYRARQRAQRVIRANEQSHS